MGDVSISEAIRLESLFHSVLHGDLGITPSGLASLRADLLEFASRDPSQRADSPMSRRFHLGATATTRSLPSTEESQLYNS
eukprot:CAMPEP_0113707434 /NCGR_PEP_ID=MMETSP0038_2-20120614/28388_1 /TAXON_ID=2898 /ORGANISM="Cryptomonas paramecium" /LENGTH=80 /DNA_ID=CAMNT_0000632957 /DNA_START=962 /DNA_END=1201 /DNA_ORIENTATION=+ /assembly_acc=CAM_ASM_000170